MKRLHETALALEMLMSAIGPSLCVMAMALGLILGGLASCAPERSEKMQEAATVEDKILSPATHGTGSGISSSGHAVFVNVKTPTTYSIIFQCQHGRFVISGSDDRHKELFLKLKKDERVTVLYYQLYQERSDGKHITGYKFVDANKEAQ